MKREYSFIQAVATLMDLKIKAFMAVDKDEREVMIELVDGKLRCSSKGVEKSTIPNYLMWTEAEPTTKTSFNVALKNWIDKSRDIYCVYNGETNYFSGSSHYLLDTHRRLPMDREKILFGEWYMMGEKQNDI